MTIYDIANLAQVSPATVSRVLNNKPGVSKDKRKRISEIIEKNSYTSNRSEDGKVNAQKVIGILTDDPVSEYQNIGSLLSQNALHKAGYRSLIRCVNSENDSVEQALQDMHLSNAEGILMMGYSFTDKKRIEAAVRKYLPNIPVVLVRQNVHTSLDNIYAVATNEQAGIHHCVRELIHHGRKHLLLIMDAKLGEKVDTKSYFEDILRTHREIQYHIYDDIPYSIEGGRDAAARIMNEYPETDGILCIRDRVAIGLLYGLQALGKKIPDELSLIGKDNSKLCEASNPQLTSLDSMLSDCAIMSVHLLLGVLSGTINTHRILLDMNLVYRGTL